jgi:hypothetical protein
MMSNLSLLSDFFLFFQFKKKKNFFFLFFKIFKLKLILFSKDEKNGNLSYESLIHADKLIKNSEEKKKLFFFKKYKVRK